MKIIQSFVWHDWNSKRACYLVSTIERDSSDPFSELKYNETFVWAWDWDKEKRGDKILFEEQDAKGSIRKHQEVCEQIFNGNYGWMYE